MNISDIMWIGMFVEDWNAHHGANECIRINLNGDLGRFEIFEVMNDRHPFTCFEIETAEGFITKKRAWEFLNSVCNAEFNKISADFIKGVTSDSLSLTGGTAMPQFTISEIIAKINEMYGEYGTFTLKTKTNALGGSVPWLWFKASEDHYGVQPGPDEVGVDIERLRGRMYMSLLREYAWGLIKDYERHVLEAHSTEAGDRSAYYRVIFNDPATIVLWRDGTKTVVKCRPGETYDPEKGLAMCIAKKTLGNKGNYYELFKDHLTDYYIAEGLKELK